MSAPPRRLGWRVGTLVALANLMVLLLVGYSLHSSHRQYEEQAAVVSRNTNRLVAQSIAGEIDRINLGLCVAADEAARLRTLGAGDEIRLDVFLSRQSRRLPMVEMLGVTDSTGTVLHLASQTAPAGLSVAERDYFLALLGDPSLKLAISRPVTGRVSGKAVLIFARRIERAGRFDGVVFASVGIDWFERKFRDLEVGTHGVVVMRGDASRDFDLLARYPAAGFVGQTKVSTTFRDMIAASPQEGSYEARGGADDVLRSFSYRAIADYPLITLVGLASEDVFIPWRRDATKLATLAGLFFLATILAGWTTLRAWRSLARKTADLARSNADLEQFAFVASHDLQTPLRNVVSYTQLLALRYRGRLDPEADEFINFIVEAGKHMSELIRDLLDYARTANVAPPPSPIDSGRALDTAIAELATLIDEAGARVTLASPLPEVVCETTQLASIFQNLIRNALRYRHPDRPSEIAISATPDGDGMWQFAVADNGIGIDRTYFDKIFVIFQRLEPAKYPGGTGIGLAQCRAIVSRLGGRIWVESEVGHGTTFLFTLPAAQLPQA